MINVYLDIWVFLFISIVLQVVQVKVDQWVAAAQPSGLVGLLLSLHLVYPVEQLQPFTQSQLLTRDSCKKCYMKTMMFVCTNSSSVSIFISFCL